MSLHPDAHARIAGLRKALLATPEHEIEHALRGDPTCSLTEHLRLGREGKFAASYAPFDWINDAADIVLVGITPGLRQATDALAMLRRELSAGRTIEAAAEAAKTSASFKGMRTMATLLMDSLHLNAVFGLGSCSALFEESASRVHSTSVLRYPLLKNGTNFSGDRLILNRPMMRAMIEEYLAPELTSLPNAWIVPFGPNALAVLDDLARRGVIDEERLLGGVLHPGGQQWNRYNVQLGRTSGEAVRTVPGGEAVVARSASLRAKALQLSARSAAA